MLVFTSGDIQIYVHYFSAEYILPVPPSECGQNNPRGATKSKQVAKRTKKKSGSPTHLLLDIHGSWEA